jgi:Tfp pilus assembly protein PilN
MFEEERMFAEQEISQKQSQLNRLKRKLSQSGDNEKKIKELELQEENLKKKLLAVKEAISEKKNPGPLLLYIAKNIPKELWISELSIDKQTMDIKGESLDYVSIGNFINALKSSVFIKEANIGGTSSVVRESDKRRIEKFEVKFTIGRFEQ